MTVYSKTRAPNEPEMILRQRPGLETVPLIKSSEFEEDESLLRFDKERFYFSETRRIPLLTANEGKIAARRVEMGNRVLEIKQDIEKGRCLATGSRIFPGNYQGSLAII